jgi:hypothetical protein
MPVYGQCQCGCADHRRSRMSLISSGVKPRSRRMGSLRVARWRRVMRLARAFRAAAIVALPRRTRSPNRVRRGKVSRSTLVSSENNPRSRVSSLMIKFLRPDTSEPWLSNSARTPASSSFVIVPDTMGMPGGADHPQFCIAAFTVSRIKFHAPVQMLNAILIARALQQQWGSPCCRAMRCYDVL